MNTARGSSGKAHKRVLPQGNFHRFDPSSVPSPCLVIDQERLEENSRRLARLRDEAGCKVLLALKAFALPACAPILDRYLDGTAASGLWEAKLGREAFGGEVHTYAPGLKPAELPEMVASTDALIFNSLGQYHRFAPLLANIDGSERLHLGLRINPRHQEVENALYDPAGPWSRLGIDGATLSPDDLEPFSFLHIHALCDHAFEAFARMVAAIEARLGHLFEAIEEINLGGGVLWTDDDFPLDEAIAFLTDFRARTGLRITLEPGTAVALHAGAMVGEVLDVMTADQGVGAPVIVTDLSATCHMPDALEAPFTPDCLNAETLPRTLRPNEVNDPNIARVGGPTCLAGDTIGTYRFNLLPQIGERLVFTDLGYYTTVKGTTFNGTPLPAIALWDSRKDAVEIVATFGWNDFATRLGPF
ncbi:carboxynorspermidine decarboxylase [Notoacmeibacter sp. MSK16QG-6]|uniref:carboxynorspermidine decarboxylase n=1 Tax=Notoacmeibacter sp. MSK16QG-6 TaxID=2957982 RepID=UPI00209D4986|nr:carboxynorspermidine decarboxylase [Notoacmeibacter sp. MSK16QG-6]MCP1199973.1 carboxynorspermidine decarboxylase [Notoacmeibacter sp. MSK16QG-6]